MKRIQSLIGCIVTSVLCMGIVEYAVAEPKIYWTVNTPSNSKIQRANVDGSEVEDLAIFSFSNRPSDLALDVKEGKMYWASRQGTISRANLDGTGVETLVSGIEFPEAFALDVTAGRMYWTNSGADKIQRANLDGSVMEDLVVFNCSAFSCNFSGGFGPRGIALDVAGGKLYWVDDSSLVNLVESDGEDSGFDLNLRIKRTNLDGSDVEAVMTRESNWLESIATNQFSTLAVDSCNDKVYWSHIVGVDGVGIIYEEYEPRIQRANLDSSGAEVLLTSSPNDIPQDIALDVVGGKMYWTDNNIKRANLDGSGAENLVTAATGDAYENIALDWTGAASGEASFRSNVLTIPVLQVGDIFYRVELTLLDAQTLEFGIGSAELVDTSGTGCQSNFANNILTIPVIDIGEASYRAELTLVGDDPIILKIIGAVEI